MSDCLSYCVYVCVTRHLIFKFVSIQQRMKKVGGKEDKEYKIVMEVNKVAKAVLRMEQHRATKETRIMFTQAESKTDLGKPRMFCFKSLQRHFKAKLVMPKTIKETLEENNKTQKPKSLEMNNKQKLSYDLIKAGSIVDTKPRSANTCFSSYSIDSLMKDVKTSRDFCKSLLTRLSIDSNASDVYRKPPETLDVPRLRSIVSDTASVAFSLPPFMKHEDILIGLPSLNSLPKLVDDNADKHKGDPFPFCHVTMMIIHTEINIIFCA